MWVRGLKRLCQMLLKLRRVAPYVGAWIETFVKFKKISKYEVAPYVGAWIETLLHPIAHRLPWVAPYVGAWIET